MDEAIGLSRSRELAERADVLVAEATFAGTGRADCIAL